MKARDMLKEWAKYAEDRGMTPDAAALRELDSLMEEVVKFLSDDTPWDEVALLVDKWLGRAAQAGYGER